MLSPDAAMYSERAVMPPLLHSLMCAASAQHALRAESALVCDDAAVKDEPWRRRLAEAVDRSGRSWASVSEAAGLSRNYLGSVLRDGGEPTIPKLFAVCRAIGVSPVFVLYGIDTAPETLELLRLIEAHPDRRDAILALLQSDALPRE